MVRGKQVFFNCPMSLAFHTTSATLMERIGKEQIAKRKGQRAYRISNSVKRICMRFSKLFSKTSRHDPADEEAVNAKLLIRAGYVEKMAAGVYAFLPLGLRVLQKIANIVREEMNAAGAEELLMPVLHPKELWEQTNRWQSFDALYKMKGRDGREFALGPTHEETVVPIAKKFISSYQDLPKAVYQIQTKFRDEPRAKSGLLRGREFLMKDLYSFHADADDLKRYYDEMKEVYAKTFRRLALDARIVEASGGSFSKFSHEFQVLSDAGEDTVFYCKCGFAQNGEIFRGIAGDPCPNCGKRIEQANAIEVGNIFELGTKFSEPFKLTYRDKGGAEKPVVMGCYGIGLSRIMGTLVEAYHDERGMIWPAAVAPFRVHLAALAGKETGMVAKTADKVYADWRKAGLEAFYDDRNVSPGEKFADADLLGIPFRAVISERTGRKIEIKARGKKMGRLVTPREALRILSAV